MKGSIYYREQLEKKEDVTSPKRSINGGNVCFYKEEEEGWGAWG